MPPKKSSAKKKKAGANRGFATTSVKSKAQAVEEQPVVPEQDVSPQVEVDTAAEAELEELKTRTEQSDRIKSATVKEITRTVKIINFKKRMARDSVAFGWNGYDKILEFISQHRQEKKEIDTVEDNEANLIQVITIYGVLASVGFDRDTISAALVHTRSLGLDHTLDYIFLNATDNELRTVYDRDENKPVHAPYSVEISEIVPDVLKESGMDVIAVPEKQKVTETSPKPAKALLTKLKEDEDLELISEDLRQKIDQMQLEDSNDRDDEIDIDRLEQTYAELKLAAKDIEYDVNYINKVKELTENTFVEELLTLNRRLKHLNGKMAEITSDYTFRPKEGESIYRQLKIDSDVSGASRRLKLEQVKREHLKLARKLDQQEREQQTSPGAEDIDDTTADNSDDDEPLGLDTLEERDELETKAQENAAKEPLDAARYIVYDLDAENIGKSRIPAAILDEILTRTDPGVLINYHVEKVNNYFKSTLFIAFSDGNKNKYTVDKILCRTAKESRYYIALVCLFDLLVLQETDSNATAVRSLPTVLKSLWDEWSEVYKRISQDKYFGFIEWTRSILAERRQTTEAESNKSDLSVSSKHTYPANGAAKTEKDDLRPRRSNTEKSMLEFLERQKLPAYSKMREQRDTLPIAAYREKILEIIKNNQCMILCGETGCGKSTQVPSFIVEHFLAQGENVKVYCTEPRRISAISLARRVSVEFGEAPTACGTQASYVGYSIRFNSKVTANTKIVYATTGIVLRMLENKTGLTDCTHIIVDEVHERSIDSDFLLIVLRRLLKVRPDLKVILMSATVDAEKISKYMGGCPIINVPGRTFPVQTYYLEDVLKETEYTLQPTEKSPYLARTAIGKGLTEEDDISDSEENEDVSAEELALAGYPAAVKRTIAYMNPFKINFDLILKLLERICFGETAYSPYSKAILIFLPSLDSITTLNNLLHNHPQFRDSSKFSLLILHSSVSIEDQSAVFDVPPEGKRKIVISTNIAETGVTIPDITCVIDSGKHRDMRYDEKRQMSRLVETFVAQSNVKQRRGRAGRVSKGLSFHLFTKHRFESMESEPDPEMKRLSLQDLALRIKSLKFKETIETVFSEALDPPLAINVQRAVGVLVDIKALTTTETLTPLGNRLSKLPMDVHLGKFLLMAGLFKCIDAALTIIAVLNSKTPFVRPIGEETMAGLAKQKFKTEDSDFLSVYHAYKCWREACENRKGLDFARSNYLSPLRLETIEELKRQYFTFLLEGDFVSSKSLGSGNSLSYFKLMRSGRRSIKFLDVPSELDVNSIQPNIVMACMAAALHPRIVTLTPKSRTFTTWNTNKAVMLHPSSINYRPGVPVDFGDAKYAVYYTALQTSQHYIVDIGPVDDLAFYLLCGNAEYHLLSNSILLDKKLSLTCPSEQTKGIFSVKVYRDQYQRILSAYLRHPQTLSAADEEWIASITEAITSSATPDQRRAAKNKNK